MEKLFQLAQKGRALLGLPEVAGLPELEPLEEVEPVAIGKEFAHEGLPPITEEPSMEAAASWKGEQGLATLVRPGVMAPRPKMKSQQVKVQDMVTYV